MHNYILGFLAVFAPTPALAANLGGSTGADVWQMVWSAGPVVQGVLFILIVFSVVSWGLILAKLKSLREAKRQNHEFDNLFWNAGSLSAAQAQTKHLTTSPLAGLFSVAYGELDKVMRMRRGEPGLPAGVMPNLKRALDRAQAAESTRLGKAVTFLATTANTAPFIGLFGTVWGIMDAFRGIGATGAANLATVAPGIAEALVATATGLFAAIPAVVFYNHFNRRLVVLEAEMDSFSQDFLNLVERDLMRRHGPAVEVVRPSELEGTKG
ncbi:MAG: protein TolQ [Proteobacteria bacterium]|nr:protein TolQ [Pseudomonadota bacterium]MBU4277841.1 protein TolQ [Pseudomonadota bacterium]MBU4385247.1 protein TolQ [Pseudomonadota bacterium]MBU4605711.1 protein TolQ [Pseudomonadota bacterium]MCG2764855.1 protein TolQ [Desulfarculaceae bacterium]